MRTLDQSCGQFQPGAQLLFQTPHLSVIGFMIVPGEVEEGVQQKDFQFFFRRMPQLFGVHAGDVGGNGYVAGDFSLPILKCGKRQHIGRLVFAAELAV